MLCHTFRLHHLDLKLLGLTADTLRSHWHPCTSSTLAKVSRLYHIIYHTIYERGSDKSLSIYLQLLNLLSPQLLHYEVSRRLLDHHWNVKNGKCIEICCFRSILRKILDFTDKDQVYWSYLLWDPTYSHSFQFLTFPISEIIGYLQIIYYENTSLAALGALAQRLQYQTACKFQNGPYVVQKWPN